MEDCQNEIKSGTQCLDKTGQTQTYCGNGFWYPEDCQKEQPNFAKLPGFPHYEAYQRGLQAVMSKCDTTGSWTKDTGLTSLGEQAQTLAARMPALLKAAAEAAKKTYPGDKFKEDLAAIRALNEQLWKWSGESSIDFLRAQALTDKLLKEEEERRAQSMVDMGSSVITKSKEFIRKSGFDPDGALTPLPIKPAPQRTVSAPSHDFIGALYKPYMSPI